MDYIHSFIGEEQTFEVVGVKKFELLIILTFFLLFGLSFLEVSYYN